MSTPGTAAKTVIAALVSTFTAALEVPVYNRRATGQQPDRAYLVVGADSYDDEADAGRTATEYIGRSGHGQHARLETVWIHCLAVYRATTEDAANDGALDLHDLAAAALAATPKLGLTNVFDALAVSIDRMRIIPTRQGRTCALSFTVQAKARLV